MFRMTLVAALAAGLFLGCNKQEPATQAPGPEPKPKVTPRPTEDETLGVSGPPRSSPTPLPSYTPIATPRPSATPVSQPAGPSRKYVVKKGDTLMNIARVELGNEHRVKEIQALNPGLDPTKLKVGQEILVPAK